MKKKKKKSTAKVISLIRIKLINGTDTLRGTCLQLLKNNPAYQHAFTPVIA